MTNTRVRATSRCEPLAAAPRRLVDFAVRGEAPQLHVVVRVLVLEEVVLREGAAVRHQQRRRDEVALVGEFLAAAAGDRALRCERVDAGADIAQLFGAGHRAHPHLLVRRVADLRRGQPGAELLDDRRGLALGHQDAAHRRALLPGLLRHVDDDVLQELAVGVVVGADVLAEDGRVEGIRFEGDPHVGALAAADPPGDSVELAEPQPATGYRLRLLPGLDRVDVERCRIRGKWRRGETDLTALAFDPELGRKPGVI